MGDRPNIQPQRVDAPLTQFATFLVLSVNDNPDAIKTVRSTIAGIEDLTKNITIRDLNSLFTSELRPFQEVKGQVHTAISTPGDILFHIRGERRDLCFEFERQLMDRLGDAVSVVDETVGFRYFDIRDLLGFVDGTANPIGPAVPEAKYVHDLTAWKSLKTEQQEAIIGRTKADNIELDDADSGQQSHKTLTTIEDEGGEHEILRDNMPFGSPGSGEFGTYFTGYTARLWVIERMMQRMFVGNPPGLHDRILDFSRPLTGTTFFAPSASALASLEDD
ncbi:hypothetical protein SI65_05672 [Aspergillus cristatus]|uniref:Deferrochelatase/peroxidase YfeX n=1 Tax=Aspergillus cristatus TaxID=573508 RepID=A0A1E3BDK1_ASPCR|nr:hypothetical protein SI65_05672 [Aspergillus cristatus]